MYELSPADARAQAAGLTALVGAGPALPSVEDFSIPTTAGEIAARQYVPDDPVATVLWLHGGGWVICDLDSHDAMCRLLARSSGARVIAPRLPARPRASVSGAARGLLGRAALGRRAARRSSIDPAERLRAAGVPVTQHHYDDMIHAFFSLVNLLERGNEAVEQVGADVRAALARPRASA